MVSWPTISDPNRGEWLTIVGRITKSDLIQMKSRRGQFLKVKVTDDNEVYEASFFNPKYIRHQLRPPGARVMMAGTVKYFREQIQLSHPEWMILPDGDPEIDHVVGSKMLTEMYAIEEEVTREHSGAHPLVAMFDREILPMYRPPKRYRPGTSWARSGGSWTTARRSPPMR